MAMLSFRVDKVDAENAKQWADALGIELSELLREALHQYLDHLASEKDPERRQTESLDETEERSVGAIANWGPAKDWSDWIIDVTR